MYFIMVMRLMTMIIYVAGYRLLRVSTYISGVLAGFILSHMIFLEFSHLAYPLMLCITGSIAVSFGFVTMLVEPVAVICLALQSGVCIGSLKGLILHSSVMNTPIWTFYLLVAISTVTVILLTLPFRLQKSLIIFNTTVTGAALIATFIDNFLFNNATLVYVYSMFKSVDQPAPCISGWVFIGVCLTATVTGLLVQSLFTGRGVTHHKGKIPANCKANYSAIPYHNCTILQCRTTKYYTQ